MKLIFLPQGPPGKRYLTPESFFRRHGPKDASTEGRCVCDEPP